MNDKTYVDIDFGADAGDYTVTMKSRQYGKSYYFKEMERLMRDEYFNRVYDRPHWDPRDPRGPDPGCCRRCNDEYQRQRFTEARMMAMYEDMLVKMTALQVAAMKPPVMLVPEGFELIGTDKDQPNTMKLLPSKSGSWDKNAIKQLLNNQENKKMNVVKRLKTLGLSADEKLLRKFGMTDTTGSLTDEGKEALWDIVLDANKATLVSKLKELEADEKSNRGKK